MQALPGCPAGRAARGVSAARGSPGGGRCRRRSYQVSAQEVEAESSLDQTNLREPAAEQAVYDENELVTAIVEFEAPAVMDYYQTSTYATPEEGTSAGQAVSEFLASDDAQQTAQQLLDEQQGIIDQITALTGAGAISTMAADGSGSSDGVVARWSTLVNGMAIQVPYGILEEINQLDGVRRAYVEHVYDRPVEEYGDVGDDAWYSHSYDKVDVQEAWADGYTGQGHAGGRAGHRPGYDLGRRP